MPEERRFTLQECADYMNISKRTLQRKIKEGKIIPVWGKIAEFVKKSKADAYMKTQEYKNRKRTSDV